MPKYELREVYGKITHPAPQEWRLLISDADEWGYDGELRVRLDEPKQRGDNRVQLLVVTAGSVVVRTALVKSRLNRSGKPETVVMGLTGLKWNDADHAAQAVLWDTAARLTPEQAVFARAALSDPSSLAFHIDKSKKGSAHYLQEAAPMTQNAPQSAPKPIKVYDNVNRAGTRAVQYHGTPDSLTAVCRLNGVMPALDRIEADGATVIHIGPDLCTLLNGDWVIEPFISGRANRYGDKRGDRYTQQEFEQRFTVILDN